MAFAKDSIEEYEQAIERGHVSMHSERRAVWFDRWRDPDDERMMRYPDTRPYCSFGKPTAPDRWIRDPDGGLASEGIWNSIPDEAPPEGTRFEYKDCANGYVMVFDDDTVFVLVIHDVCGPPEYTMGWPVDREGKPSPSV